MSLKLLAAILFDSNSLSGGSYPCGITTSDTLSHGGKFRTLNIIDDCTRECLDIEVSRSLPSASVIAVLERLEWCRGLPKEIVVDNGPEFTSKKMIKWACNKGVNL